MVAVDERDDGSARYERVRHAGDVTDALMSHWRVEPLFQPQTRREFFTFERSARGARECVLYILLGGSLQDTIGRAYNVVLLSNNTIEEESVRGRRVGWIAVGESGQYM